MQSYLWFLGSPKLAYWIVTTRSMEEWLVELYCNQPINPKFENPTPASIPLFLLLFPQDGETPLLFPQGGETPGRKMAVV